MSVVTLVFDQDSSETAANDSATCTASKTETKAEDESATPAISTTETESDDEGSTSTLKTSLTGQTLKEQTEETRLNLLYVAGDTEIHGRARGLTWTAAAIVRWWQHYAGDDNPTSHQIDFGLGSPINLLMVLALLPEKYQGIIRIGDMYRSPFGNGENLSWVHEQTTDVLVGLSLDLIPGSIQFGQGLASMIRDDVDTGWRDFTGRSWLEDQIHLWSNGELEPGLYRFPTGTTKIVFFFNPTEIHWTVVEVDLDDEVWTYTLYNSLSQGEKGPTWEACQEQFPLLEQLICRASGFVEPYTRGILSGMSAQQDNPYDCGPIAIYNAIELLEGRTPKSEVDTEQLRKNYLERILGALELLNEALDPPAFRAFMRKVCLDNLI
ncbi:MAG: hypothetical protein Q9161_004844 [Pseudevernia consocians]